jgi:hypothetical protein
MLPIHPYMTHTPFFFSLEMLQTVTHDLLVQPYIIKGDFPLTNS